jgi:hypothetical protein
VAFGRAMVGVAAGKGAVARRMVGAGAAIVGAGAPAGRMATVGAGVGDDGAPTGRSGTVGAGAGGRGGPPATVGAGGAIGTGGRTGGAIGTVAEGTDGGAPAGFKVTRTVSFFRGTLDVCLDGAGGWISFSLMRSMGLKWSEARKADLPSTVKPPTREIILKSPPLIISVLHHRFSGVRA